MPLEPVVESRRLLHQSEQQEGAPRTSEPSARASLLTRRRPRNLLSPVSALARFSRLLIRDSCLPR